MMIELLVLEAYVGGDLLNVVLEVFGWVLSGLALIVIVGLTVVLFLDILFDVTFISLKSE